MRFKIGPYWYPVRTPFTFSDKQSRLVHMRVLPLPGGERAGANSSDKNILKKIHFRKY